MKRLLLLLLFASLFYPGGASTTPAAGLPVASTKSLGLTRLTDPTPVKTVTAPKKLTGFQKLKVKMLQKHFRKQLRENTPADPKKTISVISMISGVLGIVLLFVAPVASLILFPVAVVTGIIGINNNPNPKSRTKALIGLITGLVGIVLFIVALLAFVSGSVW